MTDNLSKSIKATEHELSWANRGLKGNCAADGNLNTFDNKIFIVSVFEH